MRLLCVLLAAFFTLGSAALAELDLETIYAPQAGTQIRDIHFLNSQFGVAVGFWAASSTQFTGVLAITRDGGKNWEIGTLDNTLFFSVDILNENELTVAGIFLGNGRGLSLRSADGGTTWTSVRFNGSDGPDVVSLYSVEYLDDTHLIAGGFNGAILHSNDGGETWTSVHSDMGWSIWNVVHKDDLFLATSITQDENDNILYKLYSSSDAGMTWAELTPDKPEDLNIERLRYAPNGDLYGFGNVDGSFAVARSVNNGESWTTMHTSNHSGSLKCCYIDDEGAVYAGGEQGKVVYNQDGQTWEEMYIPAEQFLWDVDGFGDVVWLTSSAGRIYEYNPLSTSVHEFNERNPFIVFVMPNGDNLNISGLATDHNYSMQIGSIDGRSINFNVPADGVVAIDSLPHGAYVYSLIEDDAVVSQGKFVK